LVNKTQLIKPNFNPQQRHQKLVTRSTSILNRK